VMVPAVSAAASAARDSQRAMSRRIVFPDIPFLPCTAGVSLRSTAIEKGVPSVVLRLRQILPITSGASVPAEEPVPATTSASTARCQHDQDSGHAPIDPRISKDPILRHNRHTDHSPQWADCDFPAQWSSRLHSRSQRASRLPETSI
jgi:hypothetical protein